MDEQLAPIMEAMVQDLHSPIGIVDGEVQPPLGVVEEEKTKHDATPNVNAIKRSTKTTMDQMTKHVMQIRYEYIVGICHVLMIL